MASVAKFSARCSSVTTISRSNWNSWTVCTQGSYGDNPVRLGALYFSNLRSDIDWSKKKISKITLHATFNNAGGNRRKKLHLYEGTQTSLTGSGTDMKGTYIGAKETEQNAYNKSFGIVFEWTDPLFSGLCSWLQNTDSLVLVLYRDESGYDTWSPNYLQITDATLIIEYASSAFYEYRESEGGFANVEAYAYKNGEWTDFETLQYSESGGFS